MTLERLLYASVGALALAALACAVFFLPPRPEPPAPAPPTPPAAKAPVSPSAPAPVAPDAGLVDPPPYVDFYEDAPAPAGARPAPRGPAIKAPEDVTDADREEILRWVRVFASGAKARVSRLTDRALREIRPYARIAPEIIAQELAHTEDPAVRAGLESLSASLFAIAQEDP